MTDRRLGYTVIDKRRVKPESKKDTYSEIAKRLAETKRPIVDRIAKRVPFDNVVNMLTGESDEKRGLGLRALCHNIEQLEKIISSGYLSCEESKELRESNYLLKITLLTLNEESLHNVIEESNSVQICMTVLNGNFSERAKELAEKRIADVKV